MFTTFAANMFSGSSDDDYDDDDHSYYSGDDEDDHDFVADDDDDDDFHDDDISTNGGEAGRLEQTTLAWRRGSRADSTLGEWNRVHDVLRKWYESQNDSYKTFLGPLTQPFSR